MLGFIRVIGLVFVLISLVTACGGGGGSNKPTPTETPTTETPTPTPEPETPTPEPGTPTPIPETPTPEPGTPTPVPETPTPHPGTPTPTPIPGAERVFNSTCIPPEPEVVPGSISTEAAFPNLPIIAAPIAMVQPQNDSGIWFVADLQGHVYSFENSSSTSSLQLSLDITDQVERTDEFGLTGLAIHPNYPSDNRIFLLYNDNPDNDPWGGRSVLSSFTVDTQSHVIDANSESILLTLYQPSRVHNGGDLAFGTDGMLYASFGDSDDQVSPQSNTSLLGSIIRIDTSGSPYSIPSNNPFVGGSLCNQTQGGRVENCPEVFAYGFRNPWRMSIDQATGDVWVGDVGDNSFEEVNRLISGGNYGWPIMEGSECHASQSCDTNSLQFPIHDYGRSIGQSVIGGYVYRGSQSPNLIGQYIFGDVYSGQFFTVAADAPAQSDTESSFTSGMLVYAMAQGNDGEVYLLNPQAENPGENIFRIVGGGGVTVNMPTNLSETGCFNTQAKTSADGVFDYALNTPLWTDGAAKLRSFAIPDGETIDVLDDGDFRFPTNSVLIKHFLNSDTFLETRLLINHESGWAGYSYEWNDAQDEAVLLTEGLTKDVGDFVHLYPSRAQCNQCHTSISHNSLGLELAQLNRIVEDYNQVDFMFQAGYFSEDAPSIVVPEMYALDDEDASIQDRVKSYLHSNCSSCHRPGAAYGSIDFRYETALAGMNICGVPVSEEDFGIDGAQRVTPGDPDNSVLLRRMQTLDSSLRMPPLGTSMEDQAATQLVRTWIENLENCL